MRLIRFLEENTKPDMQVNRFLEQNTKPDMQVNRFLEQNTATGYASKSVLRGKH
jgi:hypothetical protein